ncbi:glycosyltransferase family 22 protein, partial [[Candida] arabinofermentans NRRL YB-2248]
LDLLLLVSMTSYLLMAPYTKVEESFNLQAIHDLLKYGVEDISNYDHNEFPGVVKRTFVAAVALSAMIRPFGSSIEKYTNIIITQLTPASAILYKITSLNLQILTRFLIGLFNWISFIFLKSEIIDACDMNSDSIGLWFGILQFTQFHIVYYSTRTLPNFIALPFVNYALSRIISGNIENGLMILIFTGIVFRIEILFFAGILFFVCLYNRITKIQRFTPYAIIGLVTGLISTFYIDSYFWGTKTIPEMESFIYNVIEKKSQNWGTEPIYTYFTKYLPKLFIIPIIPIMAILGSTSDLVNFGVGTMRCVSISSFLYICLMSIQPHKEWRFIIYAIPGITMSASTFISKITKKKNLKSKIYSLIVIICCFANLGISMILCYFSSLNYPGGEALSSVNLRIYNNNANSNPFGESIKVHMDVTTCMTGASLFGQINDDSVDKLHVIYDKTENIQDLSANDFEIWYSFNYVITDFDQDEGLINNEKLPKLINDDYECNWLKVDVIQGYSGINKDAV